MSLEIIILAAGKGTRMQSNLPKVLHCIGARPMLQHLLLSCSALNPSRIHVVVGHQKQRVIDNINDWLATDTKNNISNINWIEQKQQNGTGHAVTLAMADVNPQSTVMILNGDTPLLEVDTLNKVSAIDNNLNLLTVHLENPFSMGRIIRQQGDITGVVEEKDANEQQKQIKETNTNCMAAPAKHLSHWLSQLDSNNAQGEIYLPDVVQRAHQDGIAINSVSPTHTNETLGVNSKLELHNLERIYQRQRAEQLLNQGVAIADSHRLDIRGNCQFGDECHVDINVILRGDVTIGNNVSIGAHCIIGDSSIADNTVIEPHSIIENAEIGKACHIGPFARIRLGTVLDEHAKVGNFVETKNTRLASGTKVNHLSYIGDSDVGKNVNIGAGVITCNYDGANKHQTVIEDNVFVGSNCQLIAPVTIKQGATIGAGSTIRDDVEENCLAVARSKQRSVANWQRPQKKTS